MKPSFLLAVWLSVAGMALAAEDPAPRPEKYYVVEVTDFDGTETAQVLDSAAFKKLNEMGIELEIRKVDTDKKQNLMDVLK